MEFVTINPSEEPIRDYSDDRAIVATGLDIAGKIKSVPEQTAIKYFELGCLMLGNKSRISMREMASISGITMEKLKQTKVIAAAFNANLDEFKKKLNSLDVKTWESVYRLFRKKKAVNAERALRDLRKKAMAIIDMYKGNPAAYKGEARQLARLRDMIMRYIPTSKHEVNETYLKYYECCCCGEYPPPPNGFTLKLHRDMDWFRYPVCETCREEGKVPDMGRIARMYASYAINLENALNRLI